MGTISDGVGSGYQAKVNKYNQLETNGATMSIETFRSTLGDSYYTFGTSTVNNNTTVVLYIKNNSSTQNILLMSTILEPVGFSGGTFGVNTYFSIGTGQTYSSGGTALTPVNCNFESGKEASGIFYNNNPTLTGTFIEMGRYYPAANMSYLNVDFRGSIIVPQSHSFMMKCTTDNTSGTAYTRFSFCYVDK